MKHVSTILGLVAGVAAIGVLALGCGSSDAGTAATAADAGAEPTVLANPPAKPASGAAAPTRRVFALSKLYLGDTDRAGVDGPAAWKKYGYDLDGVATRTARQATCKPIGDGSVVLDGEGGIDNSFGQTILSQLKQVAPGFSEPTKTVTESLTGGTFTLLLDTTGLDDSPTQTATGLSGQLFVGGKLEPAPKFDGTDDWPVLGDLLVDKTDPSKGSKVTFTESYVTNGVWVNGTKSDITLAIGVQGVSLNLKIRNAIVSAKHSAPGALTEGTVAGFISVAEIVDTIGKVAGRLSPDACPGKPLFQTVKDIIEANADIRLAGPDSTKSCDAISIGLGFEAKAVKAPTKVAAEPPASPDPCVADAGR